MLTVNVSIPSLTVSQSSAVSTSATAVMMIYMYVPDVNVHNWLSDLQRQLSVSLVGAEFNPQTSAH